MKSYTVHLSSISDVKAFVSAASSLPCDIDIISGRYVIDAKSIMGIFSIDLAKPVKVELHGTEQDAAKFESLIENCLVK